MRQGLTEDEVRDALGDLDAATTLPAATVAALRLADRVTAVDRRIEPALYHALRGHFDDREILALGAVLAVASGWQRFIEAFGIRPDGWTEHTPMPWQRRE
jgi:alkylhydroperoxidase family enzyme